MTREELDIVLAELRAHRGDSTTVEVKQASQGMPSDIGTTICAFANMPDGGHIILGVSEAGGFSTTGVAEPAVMEAGLASIARQSVIPAPYIESGTIDHDGLGIVVCRVAPLAPTLKPARFRGDAYLRQADGDYVMGPADLHMVEVAGLHDRERVEHDSAEVPGAARADFDEDLVEALLRRARRTSPRLRDLAPDTILRQLGAVTGTGVPTTAGLYALGNYPQGLLPSLRVTAAVQLPRDGSGARTQNLQVFDGPLPDLLASTLDWVSANLSTRQTYGEDGNLRSVPEMPLQAVREALANALVHRDLGPDTLGVGRSIDIRLTAGALTITSPGGLRGVTLRQITSSSHARAAVNQRLYALAQHLRTADGANIIEGEGGGVTEILRSTVEADLRRPQLIDNGVSFTTVLWRGTIVGAADSRWLRERAAGRTLTHLQKQVLLRARDGEQWNVDDLRAEFSPMSREEAHDQLASLVRWGLTTADPAKEVPTSMAKDSLPTLVRRADSDDVRVVQGPGGKNGPIVLAAVDDGTTAAQIVDRTGLTMRQVAYALSKLVDERAVTMTGGRGHRDTRYSRIAPSGRRRDE